MLFYSRSPVWISLWWDLGFSHSSISKESACNAGDTSSIPGSGRSARKGIGYPHQYSWAFPCGSAGKESTRNVRNLGSVPELGRSPGERKGYPLQCSGLENSMDCLVHGVAKSQTWLSDFHFHFIFIHWKDWSWSWSSSTLATWCQELTH